MVIIDSIALQDYGPHKSLTLRLPKTGVTLITGDNGAGKSTIIEAVPHAYWGSTLRGSFMHNSKSYVEVVGPVTVSRTGGAEVRINLGQPYDTKTKAQEYLNKIIPVENIWRMGHVLTSDDVLRFSVLTDGERKVWLEAILGFGLVEEAGNLARKDDDAAQAEVRLLDARAAQLKVEVGKLRERIETQQRIIGQITHVGRGNIPPTKDIEATIAMTQAQVSAANKLFEHLDQQHHAAQQALNRAQVQLDHSDAHVKRGFARCPTCNRPFEQSSSKEWETKAIKAHRDAEVLLKEAIKVAQAAEGERHQVAIQRGAHAQSLQLLFSKLSDAKIVDSAYQSALDSLNGTLQHLDQAEDSLEKTLVDRRAAFLEAEMTKAASTTLSLHGARPFLLSNAYSWISRTANTYLHELSTGQLKINIDNHQTAKQNRLRMTVEGVGVGGRTIGNPETHAYNALSRGERRRVDLALTLALGELSCTISGQTPGTLFLDEAFDALDGDGVQQAASLIGRLAYHRPVVLITHNQALAKSVHHVRELRL